MNLYKLFREAIDREKFLASQLNVMLTGDEYEMLCRAAFKLGIARSAWVRERVYALLCRSYADELSPLTDASIRDNATMLLKQIKTKDAGR